jgi:xanthine/uracil permease
LLVHNVAISFAAAALLAVIIALVMRFAAIPDGLPHSVMRDAACVEFALIELDKP